jgi:hypothetical protein
MRNQTRLSVMHRGAAIHPQAEHSLAPFCGSNVHAPRSGKLPDEEVRTCRQTPQANGGALVEAWQVVEGYISFDKSRIVLLSRILLPTASMTTLYLIVSAGQLNQRKMKRMGE